MVEEIVAMEVILQVTGDHLKDLLRVEILEIIIIKVLVEVL